MRKISAISTNKFGKKGRLESISYDVSSRKVEIQLQVCNETNRFIYVPRSSTWKICTNFHSAKPSLFNVRYILDCGICGIPYTYMYFHPS